MNHRRTVSGLLAAGALASSSLLKTVRRKADAKDASGLTDLQRAPALQKTVQAAATAVGATACAQ
jgi:hypothetical protein